VLALAKGAGLAGVSPPLDAYAIVTEASFLPQVLSTLQRLRQAGVSVQMHASAGDAVASMKSQFKRADASGARFALIFGHDEIHAQQVTVKPLRDASAAQQVHSLADVASWAPALQLIA
ncbi:His/Gly/Thr/Pro-type tRNA ligase C-terminal domain-containing protein, partial [Rhodoferax sp.]|uniref:His/Gly/Thr/Pro-type tRNA ligase C-terminal domain-containing protein n=1 Tax=Rhodoferax sp. TaxID=50421 RepID=UPI0025E36109